MKCLEATLRISGLCEQFDRSQGEHVTVAVVDSGVDGRHPDLSGADISGVAVDYSSGRPSIAPTEGDVAGHGTACAGLILRVAPRATILSCRVLDRNIKATSKSLLAALEWVLRQGSVQVVNLSLGTHNPAYGLEIAKLVDSMYARGVPVVVARGYGREPDYPAAFGSTVSVAGAHLESELQLIYRPNEIVAFAAKGHRVQVPWLNGTRVVVDGSSFAAPLVAGRLARFKSIRPDLKVWELKTLLMYQAFAQAG